MNQSFLKTITEKDVFGNTGVLLEKNKYKQRPTVKVIVVNDEGLICLVGNQVNDYLQFPGGGVEENESLEEAAKRESLEEAFSIVKIKRNLGKTLDYRTRDLKSCVTYCFVADLLEVSSTDSRTSTEKEIGLYNKWVKKEEVLKIFNTQIAMVQEGAVPYYNTAFNIIRDKEFIDEFLKND